jgi:pentose-5-phosphate-3-epimerase
MTNRIALASSILSAGFARLGGEVAEAEAEGPNRIHVDVVDEHFLPNRTIGPVVVRSLRQSDAASGRGEREARQEGGHRTLPGDSRRRAG